MRSATTRRGKGQSNRNRKMTQIRIIGMAMIKDYNRKYRTKLKRIKGSLSTPKNSSI